MISKKILLINLGKSYGGAEKLIENIVDDMKDSYDFTLALDENGEFIEKGNFNKNVKFLTLDNNFKSYLLIFLK